MSTVIVRAAAGLSRQNPRQNVRPSLHQPRRAAAVALIAAGFATAGGAPTAPPAMAADLPGVRTAERNTVPTCVTPGRLMAFVKARNPAVDARFAGVATEYMRHGDELRIRWDMAFFQMILETGNLGFGGDVKPDQNNFAGLGATGNGEPGERFKDVSTGVRAHLEHLLLYAGDPPANPVAERTRKVRDWGVLTEWQRSIKGPITFAQIARKWAPPARRYAQDIAAVADAFMDGPCKAADPAPQLVADARKKLLDDVILQSQPPRRPPPTTREADAPPARTPPKPAAAPASEPPRAVEVAVTPATPAPSMPPAPPPAASAPSAPPAADLPSGQRSTLGAAAVAAGSAALLPTGRAADGKATDKAATDKGPGKPPPTVTVLNPALPDAPPKPAPTGPGVETVREAPPVRTVVGAVGAAAGAGKAASPTAGTAPPAAEASKPSAEPKTCHVFTASYGGQKAVIIKAVTADSVNYTVLDVNEGAETRETDAYIAAYAKGGRLVGQYKSQTLALDKAFELCPEG